MPSPFPRGISAWCRPASTATSTPASTASPTKSSAASISMRSWRWPRTSAASRPATALPCRRRAGVSRSPATTPSPSSTRTSSPAGGRRAQPSFPFSPLADELPPEDCDCCWLPGGYPELHAGRLAAAATFHTGLRHFAETRPVHGECGGYMVLGEGLEDAEGVRHAMAGLLGHATSFAKRRLTLGYREARLTADAPDLTRRGNRPWPRVPLCDPDRHRPRRPLRRNPRRSGPQPRTRRRAPGPCVRRLLPRHRDGVNH